MRLGEKPRQSVDGYKEQQCFLSLLLTAVQPLLSPVPRGTLPILTTLADLTDTQGSISSLILGQGSQGQWFEIATLL